MKLLRSNTKLHADSTVKDIIMSLIWDVLQQSAYLLHITPLDYYLLGSIQYTLSDTHLQLMEIQK